MELCRTRLRLHTSRPDALRTTGRAACCPRRPRTTVRASAGASAEDMPSYFGINFYEILQVDENASLKQIKSAYRQLQKRCHPDIAGEEEGNEMSMLLNKVRQISWLEILLNPPSV
eukprot:2894379-Pyramimonas_sp.AAC.2